jgi:signal transduction histidine kinase
VSFLAENKLVRGYLLAGLALVAAYRWENGTYDYWAIALYGAAGTIAGALRAPRGDRAPWLLLAGGVTLLAAGDIAWDVLDMRGAMPASPNASDDLYFVAYPLIALALFVLSRRMANGGIGTTIDALIVGVAVAAMLWPFLFATALHGKHVPLGTRLSAGAYPCWDILFLVLAMRIALMRSLHTRRTMLLVAAVFLYFVGDLFFFQSVTTYALGDWMDYMWLSAYVAFGAAALHPSPVVRAETQMSSLRRFLLLATPVALLPVAIVAEMLNGRSFTVVDGLLVSAVLLLMLGRLGSLVIGLERAQADMHEQIRLKDELISVVSHDLRTPLTSIMGYLELALDEETDTESARDFLEVVKRSAGRLHRLVEDLLFVSRAQAGGQSLDLAPVDVGVLVSETVGAAVPTADGAEIVLRSVVLTDDVALADAHRLAEMLENLLSNAIKFTPPGGRVDVWAGRQGEQLVFRVSDSGVGIAEDDRRHLFDRFYRASSAEGVPGAGLGLSIVKAIVDSHGGTVTVTSEIGAGTTFEVRLPFVVAERPARAAVAV